MAHETPARAVLPDEIERTVSLREFEQRLADLAKQIDEKVSAERELRQTRAEALDKALELQATEYARRLQDLNHAHQIALENWARSLPRELFDQWRDEYSKWRESVNTTLTTLLPLQTRAEANASHIAMLEASIASLSPLVQMIAPLTSRVTTIETLSNKLTGALILLGVMGMSGVLALMLGLARLVGVIK